MGAIRPTVQVMQNLWWRRYRTSSFDWCHLWRFSRQSFT